VAQEASRERALHPMAARTRFEHALALGKRQFRPKNVMDSEARYDRMKCAVGVRQVLCVAFGHSNVRMDVAGNANHLG